MKEVLGRATKGKRGREKSKRGNNDGRGGKEKGSPTAGRATSVEESTSCRGGQDGAAEDHVQVEHVGLRYPALDQDQDGVLEKNTAASPLVKEDQNGCL